MVTNDVSATTPSMMKTPVNVFCARSFAELFCPIGTGGGAVAAGVCVYPGFGGVRLKSVSPSCMVLSYVRCREGRVEPGGEAHAIGLGLGHHAAAHDEFKGAFADPGARRCRARARART